METKGLTTREAFAKLIDQKNWHIDTGLTASAAYALASRFRENGSVSTDKIELILQKAGGKVIQEKLWTI